MSDVVELLRAEIKGGPDQWYVEAWFDDDTRADFKVVDIINDGDRRWVRGETVIVQHVPTGEHYAFCQDIGLTECQENDVYSDRIWKVTKKVKVIEAVEWVESE